MISYAVKMITIFLCLTVVTAFTSPNAQCVIRGVSSGVSIPQNFMAEPLQEVAEGEDASAEPMESTTIDDTNVVRNFGRAGEIKEVAWTDPAMRANTNPFEMSIWAYFLFGYPLVLLADDLFHFVPDVVRDSPIGFIF